MSSPEVKPKGGFGLEGDREGCGGKLEAGGGVVVVAGGGVVLRKKVNQGQRG